MNWLSGKKTYLLGGITVIYGIVLFVTDQREKGLQTIMEGIAMFTLRAAITKSGPTF
jgi:hypothetical protein